MTPDQSTLYNKFHAISIGLRTIDKLISHNKLLGNEEINKAKEIIERLMKESDEGMAKIDEMDLGWIG